MEAIVSLLIAVSSGVMFGAGFGRACTMSMPNSTTLKQLSERREKIVILAAVGLVAAAIVFYGTDFRVQPSYITVTAYAICMHWIAFGMGIAMSVGKGYKKTAVNAK